jgi:NAD(P)-dependent dehydrogenase (short-subunit alcohol dehydrogenase family)
MKLAGKKVVVVGGSSGIGLSTAELAKAEGADVVIASRSAEKLKAAADKIGARAIAADVTSDDSVANLFKQCGQVDHVVVTAAQLRTGPFKTVSMDDVRVPGAARVSPIFATAARSPWCRASSAFVRGRLRPLSAPAMARWNR